MGEVEPQAQPPAHAHEADMLGDLVSPLAIEGPPGVSGIEGLSEGDALALAPVEEQENGVKVLLSPSLVLSIMSCKLTLHYYKIYAVNWRYCRKIYALCLKDSGRGSLCPGTLFFKV